MMRAIPMIPILPAPLVRKVRPFLVRRLLKLRVSAVQKDIRLTMKEIFCVAKKKETKTKTTQRPRISSISFFLSKLGLMTEVMSTATAEDEVMTRDDRVDMDAESSNTSMMAKTMLRPMEPENTLVKM